MMLSTANIDKNLAGALMDPNIGKYSKKKVNKDFPSNFIKIKIDIVAETQINLISLKWELKTTTIPEKSHANITEKVKPMLDWSRVSSCEIDNFSLIKFRIPPPK